MPASQPRAPNGAERLSPRRRRLRIALSGLALAAVAGSALGLSAWWRAHPDPYRPGERPDGITKNLERDLPEGAPNPHFEDVTEMAGLGGFRTFPQRW